MSDILVVHTGRTVVVPVSLGINVAGDTITSDIRTASGVLIASWVVTFDGDGTDGEIILTLDNSVTMAITYPNGFMDLKRISGGEPYAIFDRKLEVEFRKSVTT
jgi:hypothetical protein